MPIVSTASGRLTVGETGAHAPDVNVPLSLNSGTITEHSNGKIVVSKNSAASISFGGVTTAKMVRLKCVDASGDPCSVAVKLNGITAASFHTTELVIAASENASITSIIVTTQANKTTTVEYTIAG